MRAPEAAIRSIKASAYKVPTDKPEADGTFAWSATTIVVVEVEAADAIGLGYTYSDASIRSLLQGALAEVVEGLDAFDPPRAWEAMQRAVRNLGRSGLAATAISALDAAIWDLKARLLDLPLARLLGQLRDDVSVYGSGGFTTYSDDELRKQLGRWVHENGCRQVKMKVGTHPDDDPRRVAVAKAAIGDAELFVDGNGAYSTSEAIRLAHHFAEQDVRWFEEPVTSDDLTAMALVRRGMPPGMDVTAGEYGYTLDYFERMLVSGAVDCQQADMTRCGGVTGFLRVAALCEAHHTDLSGHCAPALHCHVVAAAPRLRHLEYFHDHVRIEHMLFEGAPVAKNGTIQPDLSQPGHGLVLRAADAERFGVG